MAILRAKAALHRRDFAGDPVEDALVGLAARGAIGIRVPRTEQDVERDARIANHRQWLGRACPADGVGIGTGIVVVTTAGLIEVLDAELHRRDRGVAADTPRDELVHRGTDEQVGALRLPGMRLRQEDRTRPKVITTDLGRRKRLGHAHIGVAHDGEVLSPLLEGHERAFGVQREPAAHLRGRPQVFRRSPRVAAGGAMHRLDRHEAELVLFGSRRASHRAELAECRHHGVEVRQGDHGAHATEESPPVHRFAFQKVHVPRMRRGVIAIDANVRRPRSRPHRRDGS